MVRVSPTFYGAVLDVQSTGSPRCRVDCHFAEGLKRCAGICWLGYGANFHAVLSIGPWVQHISRASCCTLAQFTWQRVPQNCGLVTPFCTGKSDTNNASKNVNWNRKADTKPDTIAGLLIVQTGGQAEGLEKPSQNVDRGIQEE